jgi:hypothetical protein
MSCRSSNCVYCAASTAAVKVTPGLPQTVTGCEGSMIAVALMEVRSTSGRCTPELQPLLAPLQLGTASNTCMQ